MCAAFRNSDYCSPQRHQTELKIILALQNHSKTNASFLKPTAEIEMGLQLNTIKVKMAGDCFYKYNDL